MMRPSESLMVNSAQLPCQKLRSSRQPLLEIFDCQVSQLLPPDPRTITYDAFIDNLDSRVKRISEAMRILAARVGQEPEQSAGVVLLGKQLADKKSLYIERYVDWARSHVATLGCPATTVIIRSLRTLLASDEDLCMISKSALRKEIDTLVKSALAPALETARRILPRSDDPQSLILDVKYNREATSKQVRDATSGAIIENLRRRIIHRRAQCPSPSNPSTISYAPTTANSSQQVPQSPPPSSCTTTQNATTDNAGTH
ncbi:uncharacterized protein EV422DRAFT_315497 [Fimicolochytrium jonesii]|uniref:uncharacterized protein n=1 Tax=Fimicolochytrium jonesii TaxID=1396493 RepID=UPI0022FECA25|nr:uncharacterized protein EV422DRAFT_315497 [Fimicolochytrium jonesii]KAI8824295.1 hypothetical protein EV422DRAFT_315497 [Fimicolochytrium jonesii]